ncbi:Ran-interacting Mog1 protein, partial [Martensiomyces pterosporus]
MPVRELYGGAMSMEIPTGMVDISDFREVPDNQEVFANASTDQSIIIEILESVTQQKEEAIKYHFEQISESNDSSDDEIIRIEQDATTDAASETYTLVGRQAVAKFNEKSKGAVNGVCILMALLRIPQHMADILITMNAPYQISENSSSF